MPYIDPADRGQDEALRKIARTLTDKGDLTWALSVLVDEWVCNYGPSFDVLGDALGSLDATSKEFYRRVVAPYEDTKIEVNGDVYNVLTKFSGRFGRVPRADAETKTGRRFGRLVSPDGPNPGSGF